MDDFDVFLNHRGPDVKGSFVAHLHDALRSAGLNPFLDKKSLAKGAPAFASIAAALERARVHVAVVSRGYAGSKHCLSELAAMMSSNKPVIPVFYDVEPAELRRVEKGQFAAAFKKHRSRETAGQVQQWAEALCKLTDITGFCFRLVDYQGDEAELKHEVVNAILRLLPLRNVLHVGSHLVGLEEQMKTCVNELKKMSGDVGVLGLVGMGGIGKTSLAKAMYNQLIIHQQFKAASFLEIGRNSSSSLEVGSKMMKRLRKQLLWDVLRIPENNQAQNHEYLFAKLSGRGPVLIVLDDIQDKDQFDQVICDRSLLASGSCIIVTSRDQHLLKLIGGSSNFYLHRITPLGCEDSQKLFNWHAFGGEEAPADFQVITRDVSKACGGLPLALKVVGSSLYGKTSNDDRNGIWPEAKEALKGDPKVMSALKWSYDCLTEPEKLMFVDIACVFCGWEKEEALRIWQSCKDCCGNGTPHIALTHLIDKSLVFLGGLKEDVLGMHDLLQDMGQRIGEVEGSHFCKGKAIKVLENRSYQDSNGVRAMNLANGGTNRFEVEKFGKMPNLHFLTLDGCHMSGNLGSISQELRYLQWRFMPLTHVPAVLNLSNLICLDLSESAELADTWIRSEPALEGCPNLVKLQLRSCTSITRLPDSIGCLSRLQVLDVVSCSNLRRLPNSIGQLTALERLLLSGCERLEALPDSITALSGLQWLLMEFCSSVFKLPERIGHMTGLTEVSIDLGIGKEVIGIRQLTAIKKVVFTGCTEEAISVLDSSCTLRNWQQLSGLAFGSSPAMTKLPQSIGLLKMLSILELWNCGKVRELPNSIGQLKWLRSLRLGYCSSLETLPDSMVAMAILQRLWIVKCTSFTRLPTSIGHLFNLGELVIQGCNALLSLPDSLKRLNTLYMLQIMDCGSSLEGLGLLRALHGLRIWGCTSIAELPGSRLVVVDCKLQSPAWIWTSEKLYLSDRRNVTEVQVVEANDCGVLHYVREDSGSGRVILQRVHSLPCTKTLTTRVKKRRRLGIYPI